MTEIPEPLTPADCDLRDFKFMPLDVLRLRDSDLAAVPDAEVFRAAVLSWCVAWHQVPAASLPNDDASLCRLLGYGRDMKGWLRLRAEGALRGYVLCADGRLYHHVVAEKARESWQKKMEQRARTAAAREARMRQKASASVTEPPTPLSQNPAPSVTEPATDNVTGSKGQGQGQGQGIEKSSETTSRPVAAVAAPAVASPPDARETLWTEGLSRLRRLTGKPDRAARGLLGQLCAAARDDCALVGSLLHEAEAGRVGDPVPWMQAAIRTRTGQRAAPVKRDRFDALADAFGLPDAHSPTVIDIAAERLA
jgi:hypothetical protein